MKKILLIIPLLILFHSCDTFVSIRIDNDSTESIYFYIGFGGNGGTLYPDTLLPKVDLEYPIKPKSAYTWDFRGGSDIKQRIFRDRDTLAMFIVSCDTVAKYGWDDVRANYRILQRYDLSVSDVESLNATIYYPPTPEMAHMKMWPPYKTPSN